MSSTVKIATVLATDPIVLQWQPIDSPVWKMTAAKLLTRFRSCVLQFPVLTTAQYAQWLAVCDINSANAPYVPEINDAAYATSPGVFNGSVPDGDAFTTTYRYHFLGSRHGQGVYLYDTQILLYMVRFYIAGGGGG